MRRLAAWAVAVPLILAGTEVAHTVAYRIVYPDAHVRWQVLAATGHGYLSWAPILLGLGLAVAAAGLGSTIVDSVRRRPPTAVAPWAFALLPLAAFTTQEFLERWFAGGTPPWWMVEQPTFRIGLLLQLPFAALAYLAARVLLRAARTVAAFLRERRRVPVLSLLLSMPRPRMVWLRRLPAPALGWGLRGPPALV